MARRAEEIVDRRLANQNVSPQRFETAGVALEKMKEEARVEKRKREREAMKAISSSSGTHEKAVWESAATWQQRHEPGLPIWKRTKQPEACVAYLSRLGYQAADLGHWKVNPAREPPMHLSLGIIDHVEEAGYTWYRLGCSLGTVVLGEPQQVKWTSPRRLVQLRDSLHHPVKELLGDKYSLHFSETPFARLLAPRGTTARVHAWLGTLAAIINKGEASPAIAALTLHFLRAPTTMRYVLSHNQDDDLVSESSWQTWQWPEEERWLAVEATKAAKAEKERLAAEALHRIEDDDSPADADDDSSEEEEESSDDESTMADHEERQGQETMTSSPSSSPPAEATTTLDACHADDASVEEEARRVAQRNSDELVTHAAPTTEARQVAGEAVVEADGARQVPEAAVETEETRIVPEAAVHEAAQRAAAVIDAGSSEEDSSDAERELPAIAPTCPVYDIDQASCITENVAFSELEGLAEGAAIVAENQRIAAQALAAEASDGSAPESAKAQEDGLDFKPASRVQDPEGSGETASETHELSSAHVDRAPVVAQADAEECKNLASESSADSAMVAEQAVHVARAVASASQENQVREDQQSSGVTQTAEENVAADTPERCKVSESRDKPVGSAHAEVASEDVRTDAPAKAEIESAGGKVKDDANESDSDWL